jgi:iron-sulfur cluster assembly accessory protein
MTDLTVAPSAPVAAPHTVSLTEAAAGKARTLLEQEGNDDLKLRIEVSPGGCSGLIYRLYFDENLHEGDAVVDFSGVGLVVDKMSVPYLDGASIDFEDSIQKYGFSIDNPNAQGSCACGDSFH